MSSNASQRRRFDRDVDGILVLDKSTGMTSNAALQEARGLFRALKAGHAGSLDPLASGMLPICFGHATKVCAFLLEAHKTYRFEARLGERTDTGDADGSIVERRGVPVLDEGQIQLALLAATGEQLQVPPMYSALKHQGQRLYELARRGEEVERAPRSIVIESLRLLHFDQHELTIEVHCSKGTYVRTLAENIASRLGTIAHLTALRRLQVSPFEEQSMLTLAHLAEVAKSGLHAIDALLVAPDQALMHLPAVSFDASGTEALLRGQGTVGIAVPGIGAWVRMYGPEQRFLGLGEIAPGAVIQPRRLFVDLAPNEPINL